MSRWRIVVVILLLAGPFAVLAAVGAYYLWTLPWGFLSWWALAGSIAAGYLLAWYCAVTVWSHLVVAEIRAAHREADAAAERAAQPCERAAEDALATIR
jgi:hypothetical protein